MPIRSGLTVDDALRVICTVSQAPKHARAAGLAEDTPEQRKLEEIQSNAGYFMLSALGYEHEEIRRLLQEAK